MIFLIVNTIIPQVQSHRAAEEQDRRPGEPAVGDGRRQEEGPLADVVQRLLRLPQVWIRGRRRILGRERSDVTTIGVAKLSGGHHRLLVVRHVVGHVQRSECPGDGAGDALMLSVQGSLTGFDLET